MMYSLLTTGLGFLTALLLLTALAAALPTRRRWRRALKLLKLIAGIWIAAVVPWAYMTRQIAPRSVGVQFSETAPDMTVSLIDGREVSLTELRGKIVLLDFWATWCLPCRASAPAIARLATNWKDDGLVVIGISADTDEQAWRRYVNAHPSPRLEVLDVNGQVAAKFRSETVPSFLLIDKQGRIRWKLMGWTPYAYWVVRNRIKELVR